MTDSKPVVSSVTKAVVDSKGVAVVSLPKVDVG